MEAITISWVLYAIRDLLSYEKIRKRVLSTMLHSIPDIEIGKTFGGVYKKESLIKYLDNIIKNKNPRIVLFTAANITEEETTHFQTFIVNTSNKTLVVIDPAQNDSDTNVYDADITNELIAPFFKTNGYTVSWIDTSNTCQTTVEDVFCQSWSLYLQIQGVLHPGSRVIIPKSQDKRYDLLLGFFKELATNRWFCKKFSEEYLFIVGSYTGITKRERGVLVTKDPCHIMANMTYKDMY